MKDDEMGGNKAHMREMRNTYRSFIWKTQQKEPLGS
jgi:hypothetical protein